MEKKEEFEGISYDKISITGYPLKSILTLKVEENLNEHTKLSFTGILKENRQEKIVHENKANKIIEVYYKEKEEKKLLFCGIVTYIEMTNHEDVHFLKAEAIDASYQMDIEPKSRSFQDASMKIGTLIKEVTRNYPNCDYKLSILNKPIGDWLVQYEETDWEFLKRVASRYHAALLPDAGWREPHFFVGPPEKKRKFFAPFLYYKIEKNLEEYYFLKENFLPDAKEIDYTTYIIERMEVFKLGEQVEIQGICFYIKKAVHEIKQGILQNVYWLRTKNGLRTETIYNHKISGCSIDAKIAKVEKTKVKVSFEIDEKEPKEPIKWFPFSTMSASADGTGWYCMPEISDEVKIYFPSKKEEEAFAISAVSSYVQGENETEDRMKNPDNKYLRTAKDKQITLTAEGIFICCDSGQAQANIKSDGTLTISSNQNITVCAKENIEIEAEKTMKATSIEGMSWQCEKGGALIFDKEGLVRELGTQVKNN